MDNQTSVIEKRESPNDGMNCGMTIGQMLGNRTVRRMLSDARHNMKIRHMMSLEEIEKAYELSENAMSSIVLTAAKKMRKRGKVHYMDLATNEGEFIECIEN